LPILAPLDLQPSSRYLLDGAMVASASGLDLHAAIRLLAPRYGHFAAEFEPQTNIRFYLG
jgi:hypothetical protein